MDVHLNSFSSGNESICRKLALTHSRHPWRSPPPTFSLGLKLRQQSRFSVYKEHSNRVNVSFLHIGEGVYQMYARTTIILIIVRGMSRPAAAVSLQSVTERFRRLPSLLADVGVADRGADGKKSCPGALVRCETVSRKIPTPRGLEEIRRKPLDVTPLGAVFSIFHKHGGILHSWSYFAITALYCASGSRSAGKVTAGAEEHAYRGTPAS